MAKIEWAMWANEQAVASSLILLLGGILAVVGQFKRWEIGAYCLSVAFIIFLIEYPRSKRVKGSTRQRRFQFIPSAVISALGVVGRNYFVRFIFYLLACVPCVFQLATVMGGLCLLVTCIIYLRAAILGETWKPCERQSSSSRPKSLTRAPPPAQAPPRLEPHLRLDSETSAAFEIDENDEETYQNAQAARI